MLDTTEIDARLREMRDHVDPRLLWDENCGGSARAMVVFVGPSPGADPEKAPGRFPLKRDFWTAYWNERYDRPLGWSPGFRISFPPLVEAVFSAPYDTAGKLVARGNLDWANNPNSADVPEAFMREGAPSVLRMIESCSAELVLPMDKKSFLVLKTFMANSRFEIAECPVTRFYVQLNARAAARKAWCFRATSPKGQSLVVVKLPQHPAKILRADLATRCGRAVRIAALQIASGQPVDVTET